MFHCQTDRWIKNVYMNKGNYKVFTLFNQTFFWKGLLMRYQYLSWPLKVDTMHALRTNSTGIYLQMSLAELQRPSPTSRWWPTSSEIAGFLNKNNGGCFDFSLIVFACICCPTSCILLKIIPLALMAYDSIAHSAFGFMGYWFIPHSGSMDNC